MGDRDRDYHRGGHWGRDDRDFRFRDERKGGKGKGDGKGKGGDKGRHDDRFHDRRGGGSGGGSWDDWGRWGKGGKGGGKGDSHRDAFNRDRPQRLNTVVTPYGILDDLGIPIPVPENKSAPKAPWVSTTEVGRPDDDGMLAFRNRFHDLEPNPSEAFAVPRLDVDMGKLHDRDVVVPQVSAALSAGDMSAEKAMTVLDLLRRNPSGESFCTAQCLNIVVALCKMERKAAVLLEVFQNHDAGRVANSRTVKMLGDMCKITASPDIGHLTLGVALCHIEKRVASSDPLLPENIAALRKDITAEDATLISQIATAVLAKSCTAFKLPAREKKEAVLGVMAEHPGGLLETQLTVDQQRDLLVGLLLLMRRLKEVTGGAAAVPLTPEQRAVCLSWAAHLGLHQEAERIYLEECQEDEMDPIPLDAATLTALLASAESRQSIRLAEKVLKKVRIMNSNELAVATSRLQSLHALIPNGVVLDKVHFRSAEPYSGAAVADASRFNPAVHVILFRQIHAELERRGAATPASRAGNIGMEALTLYHTQLVDASDQKEKPHGALETRESLMKKWEQCLGSAGVLGNRDTIGRALLKGTIYALVLVHSGEAVAASKAARRAGGGAHAAGEAVDPALSDLLYLVRQLGEVECFDSPETLSVLHALLASGHVTPPTRAAADEWPLGRLVDRFRTYDIDDWAFKTLCCTEGLSQSDTLPAAARCGRWASEVYSKAAVSDGGDDDGADDAEDALLALLEVDTEEKQKAVTFFSPPLGEELTDEAATKYIIMLDSSALRDIFAKPAKPVVTPPGAPPLVGAQHQRFLRLLSVSKDVKCVVSFSTLLALADPRLPDGAHCLSELLKTLALSQTFRLVALPLSASYGLAMAPHRFRPRKRQRMQPAEIAAEAPPSLQGEGDSLAALCHKLQSIGTLDRNSIVVVSSKPAAVKAFIDAKIVSVATKQFLYGSEGAPQLAA